MTDGGAGGVEVSGPPWEKARFAWLKSVRGDGSLTPMARLLADELALVSWNSETGQCNPGPQKLAARLGCSVDTIKRALADLVAAGCIRRVGGEAGRGRAAQIVFLPRPEISQVPATTKGAQVPPIDVDKRGHQCPPSASEKGASLRDKRGHPCPPNHRKESYIHAGAHPREEAQPSNSDHAKGQDKVRMLLAEKVREGRYVTPSAVSVSMAQDMLRRGEVEAHQLRSAGIAF